ncbi:MAG: hypothetical protein NXH90_13620 [Flavobacteriaceae bacterium]|nr:hypothetical protein [Flavobacteriaceae bacterium]
MNSITSKIIGELKQMPQTADRWVSKPVEIPFFNKKKIKIAFRFLGPENDSAFIDEADRALNNFFKKDSVYRHELSELVYTDCMDSLYAIGQNESNKPPWDIKEKSEVWNFVCPQGIYLARRHRKDKDIYVAITCACDWRREYGLQLVFRQGKSLTRISDQDGLLTQADADYKSDKKDKLLRQFEKNEKKSYRKRPWWKRLLS